MFELVHAIPTSSIRKWMYLKAASFPNECVKQRHPRRQRQFGKYRGCDMWPQATGNIVLWYGAGCKAYFDILSRLGVTHECDRLTDGRIANAELKLITMLRGQRWYMVQCNPGQF